MWELLGLLGVLALWGAIGLAPWCAGLIVRREPGPAFGLLAAPVAGMAGGVLTPALGGKDMFGLGVSLLAALVAGAAVSTVVVRRLMRAARETR